jgi:hypothetical protein
MDDIALFRTIQQNRMVELKKREEYTYGANLLADKPPPQIAS